MLKYTSGSVVGKGGFIDTAEPATQRPPRPADRLDPPSLAEVVVAERGGEPSASVTWPTSSKDHQPLIGDAVINGGPGLMLIVEKLPWGNTLDVTEGVEDGHRRDAPGPARHRHRHHDLPAGDVRARRRSNNLGESLMLGSVLVVIVLALFLFDWRSALISVITIPVSLMAAGLVLYARGRHHQHDGAGRAS